MISQKKAPAGIILRAIVIVFLSLVIGVVYNSVSKEGITVRGNWSTKTVSDSLIVPYSYTREDPQAISLSQAMAYFQAHSTIFLDARLEPDFKAGHIPRALNLPFEEFERYYPKVEPLLSKAKTIITYCDGTECEASLFLARLLKTKGFRNLKIFFGGWTEWSKAGLPVQKFD